MFYLVLSCSFPLLGSLELLQSFIVSLFKGVLFALSRVGKVMLLCTVTCHLTNIHLNYYPLFCCGWILGLHPNIKDVLHFITGKREMPAFLRVAFHTDRSKALPDPDTCLFSVKLPIIHTTLEAFTRAFDVTVSIQGVGYGRI